MGETLTTCIHSLNVQAIGIPNDISEYAQDIRIVLVMIFV